MFLLHEYDIFWTFLIIASLIPILAFWIAGLFAPVSEGPEKLSLEFLFFFLSKE